MQAPSPGADRFLLGNDRPPLYGEYEPIPDPVVEALSGAVRSENEDVINCTGLRIEEYASEELSWK